MLFIRHESPMTNSWHDCHRSVAQRRHHARPCTPNARTCRSNLPPHRYLRIAVVTETYPPEINGVAGSIARVVEGLRQRGHELQLIRPRQHRDDVAAVHPGFAEMLLRGLPIPRYPELKMGLPAKRSLMRRWSFERPDVVHLATEGPAGLERAAGGAQAATARHQRVPHQLPRLQPALRGGLAALAPAGLPAQVPQPL
jgi:hypothetical protein